MPTSSIYLTAELHICEASIEHFQHLISPDFRGTDHIQDAW